MKKALKIESYASFYRDKYDHVIVLESQKKDHPASKKSYLATAPNFWFSYKNGVITACEHGELSYPELPIWEYINKVYKDQKEWMFGFFGYDLKNETEELSSENPSLIDASDCFFMIPAILIEFDENGTVRYIKGEPDQAIGAYEATPAKLSNLSMMDKSAYLDTIRVIQENIKEGEYYEINYSVDSV